MTVSYSKLVANGSSFGCFWRILCKWRGSVYKLVWRELLVFLGLYFIVNVIYRFGLNESQQRQFERVRAYFGSHTESIPMSFVLGFYVSLVVKRWWEQYRLLPWPDTLALFVSAAIPGVDERGRLMRRNIVRYAVLAYVITLQHVSLRVKKRFPTWQHMADAGFMLESEKKIFELMDGKSPMSKYWMPLVWATNIINRARKESLIQSDHVVQTMLQELSDIRRRLGSLIGYDTVCVPLVYTQVVTLSVYTYFIAQLMGRQFVVTENTPDIYFPLFTALQFCFYIGWLKVAEVLINPFGEDDDDIELNWLIDRHIKNIEYAESKESATSLQLLSALLPCFPESPGLDADADGLKQRGKPWPFAAYMIVDEMHEEHPELLKDQYWDEVVPKDLPYTVASECYRRTEPKGSAEDYKVKEADALYANVPAHRKLGSEDVYADYESVDTPLVERRKNNWFQRQLQRMGSVRSSSTTYSSTGNIFVGRPRHNSVYSQGENGGLPGPGGVSGGVVGPGVPGAQHPPHAVNAQENRKPTFYEKLARKSISRGPNKRSIVKNRPRIPTPDVARDVRDSNGTPQTPPTSAGLIHPQTYQEMGVVQVLLTPIQEAESSQSGPIHAAGTKALAQAVLSPALTSAGLGPVTLSASPMSMAMSPVTFTQPIILSASPGPPRAARPVAPAVTLTEVSSQSGSEEDSGAGSSNGSVNLDGEEKKTPSIPVTTTSTPNINTAERKTNTATKRGEVYV